MSCPNCGYCPTCGRSGRGWYGTGYPTTIPQWPTTPTITYGTSTATVDPVDYKAVLENSLVKEKK